MLNEIEYFHLLDTKKSLRGGISIGEMQVIVRGPLKRAVVESEKFEACVIVNQTRSDMLVLTQLNSLGIILTRLHILNQEQKSNRPMSLNTVRR